jgi:hypothetical protein
MTKELEELKEWVRDKEAKYFTMLPLLDRVPLPEAVQSYPYYLGLCDAMAMVFEKINELENKEKKVQK